MHNSTHLLYMQGMITQTSSDFPFTVYKEFGTYHCHEQYIIGVPRDGVVIKRRHVKEFMDEVSDIYQKPFVYIGDRINASSLELAIYPMLEASQASHFIKGYAIVSHRSLTDTLARSEELMTSKFPVKVFKDLDQAKAWALDILAKLDA